MDPQEDIYNMLEYNVKSVRTHNVNSVTNVVHILSLNIVKQECIQVGCVPPAAVAVSPAMHTPLPRMAPPCMPPCHTQPPAMHTSCHTCPPPFATHTPGL